MINEDRMQRKADGTYTVTRVDNGLALADAIALLKDRPTPTKATADEIAQDNGEVSEVHYRG
jgi:hypothetical protein